MKESKIVVHPELKAEMARSGDESPQLAKIIGCSTDVAVKKLSGHTRLKLDEAAKACVHYRKTAEELFPEYFQQVSENG